MREQGKFLRVPEVAKRLGVNENSVRRMIQRGDISATRGAGSAGSRWMIPERSVALYELRALREAQDSARPGVLVVRDFRDLEGDGVSWMTTGDAAVALGVSVREVRSMIKGGKLNGVRGGLSRGNGRWRVDGDQVAELAQQKRGGA